MKSNGERVIITAEFLIETLGRGQELAHLIFLLAPFTAETEERAFFLFDEMIKGARETEIEMNGRVDEKQGLASAWQDLRNGYSKMTVFERASVRKGIPQALVNYMQGRKS